jgi:hypothetical protein
MGSTILMVGVALQIFKDGKVWKEGRPANRRFSLFDGSRQTVYTTADNAIC